MPDETKLLCSLCFQPLDTTEYKEGLYINPCGCKDEELYASGKEEAYLEGYNEGYEEGENNGIDRGREEAEMQAEDKIYELKEQLEKYSDLIEEEEYLERLGT